MAASRKGKYPAQIIGTEQPMSRTPNTSPSADPKSGAWQLTGTQAQLDRTPTPSPTANPKSGQFQLIGTEAQLNRTAVRGVTGVNQTPMSPVALRQSKNAAEGRG